MAHSILDGTCAIGVQATAASPAPYTMHPPSPFVPCENLAVIVVWRWRTEVHERKAQATNVVQVGGKNAGNESLTVQASLSSS